MPIIGRGDSAGIMGESSIVYPSRALIMHRNSQILAGSALLTTASLGTFLNENTSQNPGANGDSFLTSCLLRTGTYTMYLYTSKQASSPLLDFYYRPENNLTFTLIQSGIDLYNAVAANTIIPLTSFTITIPGQQYFKFTVNDKNVASSGYNANISGFSIKPSTL